MSLPPGLVSTAAIAAPEIILAVLALLLLAWGAFQGTTGAPFTLAAMAGLLAAAVAAAFAPWGACSPMA